MSTYVKLVAKTHRLSSAAAFVLLFALLGTACDTMGPDRVLSPTTRRSTDVSTNSRSVAVLITQTLQKDSATFAVFGSNGGTLSTGAHTLYVPAGAVSGPTIFAIQVVSGQNIYVQLRAYDNKTGEPVTVFATPVKLTLSYSQTYFTEPSVLSVIYLPNGLSGDMVPMPSTVDQTTQTVSAWLPHFSDYTLGENRTAPSDSTGTQTGN